MEEELLNSKEKCTLDERLQRIETNIIVIKELLEAITNKLDKYLREDY